MSENFGAPDTSKMVMKEALRMDINSPDISDADRAEAQRKLENIMRLEGNPTIHDRSEKGVLDRAREAVMRLRHGIFQQPASRGEELTDEEATAALTKRIAEGEATMDANNQHVVQPKKSFAAEWSDAIQDKSQ